jgi:hypothetical protein
VTFAVLLGAGAARADDEQAARAAMRRGTASLDRGDAAAALEEYALAKRLVPAANAPWFFSAEALVRLERWREAVESLEQYLAKDPNVSDADRVRERIAKLRAEHFPARLHVVAPNGAALLVDGISRDPAATLELAPGKHRVELRAPGFEPAFEDVVVLGDTEATSAPSLRPVPPPSAAVPEPAQPVREEPRPPEREPSMLPTLGWITAGIGAAGLVTTLVIDVTVLGDAQDEYVRATEVPDPSARGLRSDAEALRRGVILGYAVSGLLVVGGATVGLLAPRSRAVRVAPIVSPRLAGLVATLSL